MVGESRNLEEGFLEEESLVFLYGEELRSFLNDDFEGSNQEGHIFTEVFYGKNAYGTAKGFRKVGMANYASDKNMQSMAVASFNSESPVPTFQPSLKGLYGRDHKGRFKETKVDGSGSSRLHKHSCGQLELGVCNLKSKHGTTSSEGPPNSQRKERGCCLSDFGNEFLFLNSSKYDPKSNMVDLNDIPQPTPYRIVESFSQGIISSCFFPSYCDGGDNPNYSDYDTPSRSNDSNDIIRDMKVDGEGKFTTPLLPGESSASKLRVGNGPNALTMNGECKIFDTDVAGSSMAFVRELPHRLRLHAQNFLLDAGWKIEGRRRKDRCKHYSIFRTPGEGVAISSLIKAWRICGECLVAGESSPSLEENGRQWLEIDGFWCDLADALAYIEREVQHLHSSMSLLHRWRLLDPFVSVVCIDKKISALREGKTVKFVKGRIVDLGSSRYLSLTEKSGPSSRKPAKFPSHSVSRSSHCLHPCKSSSSSTPVSSSMNDAVVEESILSVVKPEVTKTSHNKKLGCKNIPEVHRQVNHYPKEKEKNGSGGLRRKLSFDGEVRSVKNPAKSIGYGSNFDRRVPKKKHPGFLECSKQESTPMGAPSLIRKGLTLSSTASEPNVPLSLSPQISQSDLSEQDLKSTGAASTGIGASDSCKGFRVESQPHEEAASCQQTENLYPKGDTASYGRKKKCGKVTKVVPVFHGSNNAVILCLASNAKVAGKSHSAQKEKDKEGLNGKRLESANAQMSDQFAEVQMVQFLHTQQAVSGDLMNVASEAAVYQDACSSVVRPKHLKKKPANSTEASESGLEHSSAEVPGNKKASKRSRKISDIAATKLLHKNMKHTPPSEKYEGQIVLELDDKLSNNLDFPLLQEVDNILKVGTVPSNLITSENHKVPDGNAIEMLGTVEMSSAVTEVSMAQEKTHETPRARFVKVNRTSKKRKQQVVKPESASINLDTDPDTGECKNDCNKCQMENGISSEAASTSPLQHAKTKKYPTIGSKSKMSVASCQHLLRPQNENFTIEASIPSEGKSPQSQINQRTAKRNICESQKGNCQKRQRKDDIDDDDLLIAVIIKNRDQNSNGTHSSSNAKKPQSKGCRNLKSRKGSCKLLLRTSGKCGVPPISGARTPLGWLLNSGVVPLNAAIQCRSPKNNSILKDGRVAREGILCRCCSKIFSVSAFKCHAGCKLKQTSLNLFLESGKSYTLCQLQAWSDEYKARKDGRQVTEVEEVDQNDDTCGLCGDGGELICCDNCPSTFHQACLHSQVIPEGSWYCPNCTCKICGDAVAAKMPLGSFIMLECSQCERKYHDICLTKMGSSNDRSVSDIWFCGEHCEKVYFGLCSRVGVTKPLTDGFSWIILRCNPSDQMVQSAQKIALMAECNSKLAVALTIMEECFLPMVDPRTGINLIPQVLYGWGSNFPRLNYHGFYTIILEKDDKIISVAAIRVHGTSVAEMPLIATCSEHRRQGMCRRLMGAIEEMLRSFKVQTLVLSAIPDLIDTWTSGFGFKPVNEDEKKQLSTINLMLFPGTALLKKSLCEGFEMRKPEDETFSSSREDLNHAVDICNTRNSQQPDHSNLTAGINLVVGTTSQVYANLEVSEKENCRQPNLPALSSETLIIVANGEPDDVTVAVSGSGDPNVLASDLLSDPRSSAANKEFRDVEGASTGDVSVATCQKVMDGFHNKELIAPSGGDKISIIKITENYKGKNDGNILERNDPLNLSHFFVAGIDDTSSIDVSARCKELPSGSTTRWIPSEVVLNTVDFRVDSINGKGDGNSSTVACINEQSKPSEPVVDSTKDILDPVMVPLLITKCSRVPPMISNESIWEKNACGTCLSVMTESIGKKESSYTCCDGEHENVQSRDTLRRKVGFLPQGGMIVNNAETGNLSGKTDSYCNETALEEVERSLRDLSLCLWEE